MSETMTITVDGVEHVLTHYNDDNGYGLASCGARVGPWDLGPNLGEVNCAKCAGKVKHGQA